VEVKEPLKEQKLRSHSDRIAYNDRFFLLKSSTGTTLETAHSFMELIKDGIRGTGEKAFSYRYTIDGTEHKLLIEKTSYVQAVYFQGRWNVWFNEITLLSDDEAANVFLQKLFWYHTQRKEKLDREMRNVANLPQVMSDLTKEYMVAGIVTERDETENLYTNFNF